MKRMLVIVLAILLCTEAVIAKDSLIVLAPNVNKLWNPYGNVLIPMSVHRPELQMVGGIGGYNGTQMSFGLELGNRFFINKSLFVAVGLRYMNNKSILRTIPKLDNGVILMEHTVSFSRRFETFSVPISIGKLWTLGNNRKLETYIGLSGGVMKTGSLRSGSNYTNVFNTTSDKINQGIEFGSGLKFPSYFVGHVELGMGIQPIKQIPQLIVALFAQMQLNTIRDAQHYSTYSIDDNTNTKYEMHMSYAPGKHNSFGMKLSYNF